MLQSPLSEVISFMGKFRRKDRLVDVRPISWEPTERASSPELVEEDCSFSSTFPRRLDDQEGAGTVRRRRMVLSISRSLPQISRADSSHWIVL